MILDARAMYGLSPTVAAGDVRRHWEFTAPGVPRVFVERDRETGLVDGDGQVVATVEHGRWVAGCPACNGGIACAPDMDDAACLSCGRVFQVVFPKPADIAKADQVLEHRPSRENRNWHPGRESVDDLKVENLERGVTIA